MKVANTFFLGYGVRMREREAVGMSLIPGNSVGRYSLQKAVEPQEWDCVPLRVLFLLSREGEVPDLWRKPPSWKLTAALSPVP